MALVDDRDVEGLGVLRCRPRGVDERLKPVLSADHRLIRVIQAAWGRSRNIIRSALVHGPIIVPVSIYHHASYAETYSRFSASR